MSAFVKGFCKKIKKIFWVRCFVVRKQVRSSALRVRVIIQAEGEERGTMKRAKQTPTPCKHPGCAALVRIGSYCDKHKSDSRTPGDGRRDSAAWHGLYYTAEWKRRRADQLLREPFCRSCAEEGRRIYATDVDHIKPHRGDMQLFCDDRNLQSLCHSCHSKKTAAENQGPPPGSKMF